ncbi:unnamed protein product [Zymoseptoria tritici ST99CH_3D1]|uniref:RBR-type E3 ubiquitin transferase n=3 Tax=Zymoseptoria tritici TaxID=1047171 RepID=F9X553_ZYMTI|nr:uncharacterized protein MYCGRDRAFT_91727 [Zymoseptoria tritici IPO323]EGP89388.1 hypothetical protein MYCGRDRAFT_91727 [Zymoseptoria tritici IPO323]SMQ48849.1 unnamed protein product [Zymoseptoria tritici ST99CH_3D7]SMR48667.1 unnamed protein product [Zymoseptoria tritici ST99CH_1E4]SMR49851.1 unnamed protein product [Zymoseptoria tritici ST99CH_3D1]
MARSRPAIYRKCSKPNDTRRATKPTAGGSEPPPTKKVKTKPDTYQCTSCLSRRAAKAFPNSNPSIECQHLINTCTVCLRKWVQAQVEQGKTVVVPGDKQKEKEDGGEEEEEDEEEDEEEKTVLGIRCPECEKVMKSFDVRIAGTDKVFKRFDELERRHIGDSTPNWRWCLNTACDAGQSHEAKRIPSPKKKSRFGKKWFGYAVEPHGVEDKCVCVKCGAVACVVCDRPWHEGEKCAEYQERVKGRVEEEDQTLELIRMETKKCPNPKCGKAIEKNGGCPSMICYVCQINFCWNCLEEYKGQEFCACRRPNPH